MKEVEKDQAEISGGVRPSEPFAGPMFPDFPQTPPLPGPIEPLLDDLGSK